MNSIPSLRRKLQRVQVSNLNLTRELERAERMLKAQVDEYFTKHQIISFDKSRVQVIESSVCNTQEHPDRELLLLARICSSLPSW